MEKKNRRNLLLALNILLVCLAIVLVKNRAFWFGTDETPNVEETAQAPVPNSLAQAPAANTPAPAAKAPATNTPAPAAKKHEVAGKRSTEPVVAGPAVIPGTRTELPPMQVEVVAGDTHRTIRAGSNTVLVEMPPKSGSGAAGVMTFKWSPATNAAERTRISSDQPEALSQTVETSYPSLARRMKVQGSVLLQAFVGADGGIKDLRVLSGNPILTSAAIDAARQWRFKPYLQNGQPVETQAKIVVNFAIKIL
jgi:periplasmic protein TonB